MTREAFEAVFQSLEKDLTEDFSMSMEDIIKFVKNMKNVNPEVKACVENIIEVLLKANMKVEKKTFKLPWRKKSE